MVKYICFLFFLYLNIIITWNSSSDDKGPHDYLLLGISYEPNTMLFSYNVSFLFIYNAIFEMATDEVLCRLEFWTYACIATVSLYSFLRKINIEVSQIGVSRGYIRLLSTHNVGTHYFSNWVSPPRYGGTKYSYNLLQN